VPCSFQKIPSLMGRLMTRPHIEGRLGSGVSVSASFSRRGNVLGGEGNVRGNMSEGRNVQRNVLHSVKIYGQKPILES